MSQRSTRQAALLLRQAVMRLRSGRPGVALGLARQAVRTDPSLAEAWLAAGQIFLETGRPRPAVACLKKARTLAPDDPAGLATLGAAQAAIGQTDAAEDAFRAALALDPDDAPCRINLGLLLTQGERGEEAAALLAEGVSRSPKDVSLRRNLGDALALAGRPAEAVVAYEAALSLAPDDPATLTNLGGALRALGEQAAAAACYEKALAGREDALTWANLSGARLETGDIARAVAAAERAVALAPQDATAVRHLGDAYAAAGDGRAEAVLGRALELAPGNAEAAYNLAAHLSLNFQSAKALDVVETALAAQASAGLREAALRLRGQLLRTLGHQDASQATFATLLATGRASIASRVGAVLAAIPLVYRDEAELSASREAYHQGLLALVEEQRACPAAFAAEAGTFVGMLQPYYLAYQGRCDRDLQALYGGLVHAAHNQAFPDLAAPLDWRPPPPGARLTVGVVSGHFHQHSNWKIPLLGWLTHLSRERFRVLCYYTGTSEDARTGQARQLADGFYGIGRSWRELARKIRADKPDVLLYPEIGMHPDTLRLASLRLAPVQCASWGHPDTSGLPTMDYYLTSDAMEPDGARDHYTEELVRLPGLSCVYTPLGLPAGGAGREDFGLSPGQAVFLCPQSLPKYLPGRDRLLARIAAAVPDSRFVFIESWLAQGLAAVIRARLARAFAEQDLCAERHLLFLPHMSMPRFHDLCRVADVALDTPEWSGCNSSLEAFEQNLPVVTLPGRLMRGRHTLAFLSLMGGREMVAADEEEYVRKAVGLARDTSLRQAASALIARNKNRLYDDLRPMRALEDALAAMVARAGRQGWEQDPPWPLIP